MVIKLKNELMVTSYNTLDGRGAKIEITDGPCIMLEGVSHVIIHGLSIHDCTPGKPGMVRSSQEHVGHRLGSDGYAISVFAASNIWIDHCYLACYTDGLVDIIHASTGITVSNNYLTQHDKVMLLGHRDGYTADKVMKVTVVFNHFGPGLVQRMPRVRYGYAHVGNNKYDQWLMYAIGGSSNPTILSEGNYFMASNDPNTKEVTKRETEENSGFWKNWKWRSSKDVFVNGAYFVPSGMGSCAPLYSRSQIFSVAQGSLVPALTSNAGPLQCVADPNCASYRQTLTNCSKGFPNGSVRGKNGRIYVVADPSDDPNNPKPGTLRYGAIQSEPLWIVFENAMVLTLKNELMVNSYKTLDGRGANLQ
ncbi:hypothetical protein RJ639_046084 [Escallonia herrerae]|uniref:Pectate lyase n=1 Tax=Escallonia herrerae TaxID=1293975 RepID=A0AA88W8F5_9ASTE|nr:hypothetical protein RJ639_046084 [Escallonia herrerae]